MDNIFKPQSGVSLREKVTKDLRDAILKGLLPPGERIKETDIANQMGVSRGPVREAIRQLEREGLVISHPYRETIVSDINAEEVRDVLVPIRFQLEWFVVKKYLERMDQHFFNRLERIIDAMGQPSAQDNFIELVEQDICYHEEIINLSNERTVALTWQSIQNQMRLHFIKNIRYFQKSQLQSDHLTLMNTLKTRDLDAIQQELVRHMKGDESFLCFIQG